jgi:hypothetical protein
MNSIFTHQRGGGKVRKSLIKKIAMRLGIEIRRVAVSEGACISLKPEGTPNGDMLLSSTINAFLSKDVASLNIGVYPIGNVGR